MRFRYKDPRGKVVSLPDVASLLRAIEQGAVTPDSQFSLGQNGAWQRADSVAAFQQVLAGLNLGSGRRAGVTPGERPGDDRAAQVGVEPWHAGRGVRIGLGTALVAGVVLLGAWRLRVRDRARATDTARAASEASAPSLDAQHTLVVLAEEFGDSAGVALRRAEDWLTGQRAGQRLRGTSLKNPASLRSVRAVAARVMGNADSLVARSTALAESLKARADSLEVGQSRYDGLVLALDEALESWIKDINEYAGLETGLGATLDSVAAFLLERQGAFTVTEGQAVFLSRADAIRFHDLNDQLGVLAERRKMWAAGIHTRRPAWMTALPDSSRPRFDRTFP